MALSIAATASQISYTANTATTTLPFTSLSANLPQFDPSLGFLQNLRMECRTWVQGPLGFENQNASPSSQYLAYFQAGCTASGPGISSFSVSGDMPWFVPALGAYDGTLDYAGGSGTTLTLPPLSAGYGSWPYFPGSTVDLWAGTGSMTMTATVGHFGIEAGGLAWSQALSVFVEFTVIYTYATGPHESCHASYNEASCPCGGSDPLGGCPNSGSGGARLAPSGSSALLGDTFTLTSSNTLPTSSVLFFQGTGQTNAGHMFGDGNRCVAGTITRLGTKVAVNGIAQYPGPGDAPISIIGAIPGPGAQRSYQAWYRDPADFCTPATYNLTSGVRTTWTL